MGSEFKNEFLLVKNEFLLVKNEFLLVKNELTKYLIYDIIIEIFKNLINIKRIESKGGKYG